MNTVRLIDLLQEGCDDETLILCATSRLAQDLQRQFAAQQVKRGVTRWPTPRTLTVDTWLQQLAEESMLSPECDSPALKCRVLTTAEVELIFEDIIRRRLGQVSLFDTTALAKDAALAHQISVIWSMPPPYTPVSEEQKQFLSWQQDFKARCQTHQWIDKASLYLHLLETFNGLAVNLPQHLLFAGFDRYTPLEHRIERACQQRGIQVSELLSGMHPHSPEVRSYPDASAECLAAAHWAAAHLQANPQARLGWVVPNLNGLRHRIEDTLTQVLAPASMRMSHHEAARVYNISLGQPLSTLPLVRSAIDLLRVAFDPKHEVTVERLSQLMVSPFWSNFRTEGDTRASLDARMREGRGEAMAWPRAIETLHHWTHRLQLEVPNALEHLNQLAHSCHARLAQRLLPSQWTECFEILLNKGGWLAEYSLSSHEFQTKQTFAETLLQLAQLDEVIGPTDARSAIKRLYQLCAQRIFQPQTTGQPALQVLGTLEASGLTFDALWVMGLNESVWPAPAQPSPFLPISWQRQHHTPNASSEVQWSFAQSVMSRLLSAAPEVICSWSRMDKDSELRPSSMLQPWLPGLNLEAPQRKDWVAQAAFNWDPNGFARLSDEVAPPVAFGEHVSGGSGLLKAQAICPAWAYFRYRLGAKELHTPQEGLDNAARGTLVHDALCVFWRRVTSLEALHGCSPSALSLHIEQSVDQAIDRYNHEPDHLPLRPNEQALERDRLIQLLQRWIAIEQRRSLAFRVIETEKSVQINLEGLDMRLQIDRIDELDDGRWIVIDYKTGRSVDLKNWASKRLTEPQLPLYAVMSWADSTDVAGVVFGKVRLRNKEAGFTGITAEEDLLPAVESLNSSKQRGLFPPEAFPNWISVLQHWQMQLHAVAREVRQGLASVTFEKESALQYCEVKPLLRLSERQLQLEQWLRGEST